MNTKQRSSTIADRIPEFDEEGVRVCRFRVERDIENLRLALQLTWCAPGEYTKLIVDNILWMSDTTDEMRDHSEAIYKMRQPETKRVIINGLGLGCVLHEALKNEAIEHIDVVEKNERVIRLIGRFFSNDPRVNFIHADAYEQAKAWPKGTRWNVGWSDIWPNLCIDNLSTGYATLRRAYGRRCDWHDCWGRKYLINVRRQDQRRWSF